MSSNLVKQMYMVVPEEDKKRVIDSNERMKVRMEQIRARMRESQDGGFVSGIAAETVEVLLDEGANGAESNVIKAGEDAQAMVEQAKRDAEAMLEEAGGEAARIIEDAKAQAEREKAQVLEQAKKQGYNEGMAQAQDYAASVEQEYQAKFQELENAFQRQVDTLEPQFVDIITSIYEHIFHVELESYREILTHLITATIRKLEGGHDFLVHVSKEDYPYVSMQKKQILADIAGNCNVEVIEDVLLDKNQCMIETENGIFDCGLGTQLDELKKKLMLLAWSKED